MQTVDTAVTIKGINDSSVLEELNAVHNKINTFLYENNGQYKSHVQLYIHLLKQDPIAGRQLKITTNVGDKYLFTLSNTAYEELIVLAITHCSTVSTYKVAPQYSYYWE